MAAKAIASAMLQLDGRASHLKREQNARAGHDPNPPCALCKAAFVAREIGRRHAEIQQKCRPCASESGVVFSAGTSVFRHDQGRRQPVCREGDKDREKPASFGTSSGDSQTVAYRWSHPTQLFNHRERCEGGQDYERTGDPRSPVAPTVPGKVALEFV
jgi:hypothetical protein